MCVMCGGSQEPRKARRSLRTHEACRCHSHARRMCFPYFPSLYVGVCPPLPQVGCVYPCLVMGEWDEGILCVGMGSGRLCSAERTLGPMTRRLPTGRFSVFLCHLFRDKWCRIECRSEEIAPNLAISLTCQKPDYNCPGLALYFSEQNTIKPFFNRVNAPSS